MLSNIASFFWGSYATDPAAPPSPPSETSINACNGKDDVTIDIIADAAAGVDAPPAPETVLSTSSLSDEEAGWVFVSNKKQATAQSSAPSPMESDCEDPPATGSESRLTRRERKALGSTPTTRSRGLPSSALHASSVLSAIAELKPQQKAQRRHKELRLKHTQLERSNKALHVSSSSNKPTKRRAMYTPTLSSRAVNNRKC